MDIRVESAPKETIVKKPVVGSYEQFSEEWGSFMEWAAGADVFRMNMLIGTIYASDPNETPEAELLSYLCVSVPEGFAAPEGMELGQFPQGKCAVVTYVGPYEGLPEAWTAACTLAAENHTLRPAPAFDLFIDDPESTPAEKLRTELWIPIA